MKSTKDLQLGIDVINPTKASLLLLGIEEVLKYEEGVRTTEVIAHKYECVIFGGSFNKIDVKVEGYNRFPGFTPNSDRVEVELDGYKLGFYSPRDSTTVYLTHNAEEIKQSSKKGGQ